jgi:hypothetical protein
MFFRRFARALAILGLLFGPGCAGEMGKTPTLTLNISNSPLITPNASWVTPTSRIVLAEVFTYDE